MERSSRSEQYNKLDYLCKHDLFGELSLISLEKIAKSIELVKVGIGNMALRKGDPSEGVYILVRGSASICFRVDGKKKLESRESQARETA